MDLCAYIESYKWQKWGEFDFENSQIVTHIAIPFSGSMPMDSLNISRIMKVASELHIVFLPVFQSYNIKSRSY